MENKENSSVYSSSPDYKLGGSYWKLPFASSILAIFRMEHLLPLCGFLIALQIPATLEQKLETTDLALPPVLVNKVLLVPCQVPLRMCCLELLSLLSCCNGRVADRDHLAHELKILPIWPIIRPVC